MFYLSAACRMDSKVFCGGNSIIPWFTTSFQSGENQTINTLQFCSSIKYFLVSPDENKPIWMHAEEREECKVRPLL